MELNREQIKYALDCCTLGDCYPCPYGDVGAGCRDKMCGDALSLIKELTDENERLRCVGIPDNEVYIRLSDAKHAIMEYACNQTVSKYASAEICKAVRNGAEGAMNELDYITPVKVAPIADTVRKMQERLKEYLDDFYNSGEDALLDVPDMIDQIAKEMVEGKND